MPIEIRELEISVAIEDPGAGGGGASGGQASTPANIDGIVALCVDQVMEILQEQKEA